MITSNGRAADRLLTVEAAAERMSTSVRFIRRLIAERRIAVRRDRGNPCRQPRQHRQGKAVGD